MQMKFFPGTTLPFDSKFCENSFFIISSLCAATGGITLSQLTEMTGLEGTTIQNWVKRGWVSKTIGKKYNTKTTLENNIIYVPLFSYQFCTLHKILCNLEIQQKYLL